MADLIFKKQIDFILNLGQGVKACLFDNESKEYISNLISFSKFQDHDFFYFSYITNKSRIPISDIFCIIIIRPVNLKNLVEELSNPFYGKYIILFTNQIDPFVLEIIANADSKCRVTEIYEIYLDVSKESDFLYITNTTKYKKTLDSLASMVLSLEIAPIVHLIEDFQPGEKSSNEKSLFNLGIDVINRANQYNFGNKGTVVLLKRHFDNITPLVYDWHYQALIKHHLEFKNNIVKIKGKEYFLNDAFFKENKFRNIHYIGDEIKKELKNLEKNKIKISNHEFEDIEEKATQSMVVETHLKIYDALLEECMKNKDFSEAQISLIKETKINNEHVTLDNLEKNIECFGDEKELILVLIYFIKKVSNWEEESKKVPRFREALLNYKKMHFPVTCPYKPTFYEKRDIKLSYEPSLKKLIKHLVLKKVKSGMLRSINEDTCEEGPLIIYIEGGITMTEYREAMIIADELKCVLYLVSDCIINTNDIIKNIDLFKIAKKSIQPYKKS